MTIYLELCHTQFFLFVELFWDNSYFLVKCLAVAVVVLTHDNTCLNLRPSFQIHGTLGRCTQVKIVGCRPSTTKNPGFTFARQSPITQPADKLSSQSSGNLKAFKPLFLNHEQLLTSLELIF